MKEFLEKLRQQVAENPPNYGDADSVLGLLYECFNENNPYDRAGVVEGIKIGVRLLQELG